jgi:hypothetical protein
VLKKHIDSRSLTDLRDVEFDQIERSQIRMVFPCVYRKLSSEEAGHNATSTMLDLQA